MNAEEAATAAATASLPKRKALDDNTGSSSSKKLLESKESLVQNVPPDQTAAPCKKRLVGASNFQEIIERNAAVVDKTMFIKDFMDDMAINVAILRPCRFGKSTNLSMLKSFFALGACPDHFDRFLIGKEKEFVAEHCGKYPVVHLDFMECKGETWEEMYAVIWDRIRRMVKEHYADLASNNVDLSPFELEHTESTVPNKKSLVQGSLRWLTEVLHQVHGKMVIVLIDEYDTPLNHAFHENFYDRAASFFGTFYGRALKSNDSLERACLMGIVGVTPGAGIMSGGLNNVCFYSVAKVRYSEYFGFNKNEMTMLLQETGTTSSWQVGEIETLMKQIMVWYNGYEIGTSTVVNPGSLMNWLKDQESRSYMCESSNKDHLKILLAPHLKTVLIPAIELLLCDKPHQVLPLQTQVNYHNQNWTLDEILHYLVHTGYLTYLAKDYTVRIPNQELCVHWSAKIKFLLLNDKLGPNFYAIPNILEATDVNSEALQSELTDMLLGCSCFDVNRRNNENSYYMVFFGALYVMFADLGKVTSYFESGEGRYDIILVSESEKKRRIISLDFKLSKSEFDLAADAKRGHDQVLVQHDAVAEHYGYRCVAIGVACFKQRVHVFSTSFDVQ